MYQIEKYNFIESILNKIEEVSNCKTDKEIVWFGRANFVPIMNTYLLLRGKRIHYVLDNAPEKWGKKVAGVYDGVCGLEDLKKDALPILIHPPKIVKEKTNQIIVFIASKYESEMVEQLISYGMSREDIYTFPTEEEDCVLQLHEVQKEIAGCHKLNLSELQQEEIKILKEFKNFCEKHKLRYWLGGGTLLGAIRHKGFIPWDDDIDVFMPTADYLRFLELYQENEDFCVCDWRTDDNYNLQFAKLVDKHTILFHGGVPIQMKMGVFVDIFPIIGFPLDDALCEEKENWNVDRNDDWSCYYVAKDLFEKVKDPRENLFFEKYLKYPFEGAKRIGTGHVFTRAGKWTVMAESFAEDIEVEFEGELYKAPKGYDAFLTAAYGDYMTVPDEKHRISHLFPTYYPK